MEDIAESDTELEVTLLPSPHNAKVRRRLRLLGIPISIISLSEVAMCPTSPLHFGDDTKAEPNDSWVKINERKLHRSRKKFGSKW